MSLVIVELLSDRAAADDYRFGSVRMPMDRNLCVTHQDIEHLLRGIFGCNLQIIIHPTAGGFCLFLDAVNRLLSSRIC